MQLHNFYIERVPQFRHMFLTIFSTILCKIIVHSPNKHHIKVSARLSKYIIVVTFHVNKWRHKGDRIISRFARYAAGCCPHNSAYLKEINHLCIKMKQIGYFFIWIVLFYVYLQEKNIEQIFKHLIIEIVHCCDRSLQQK